MSINKKGSRSPLKKNKEHILLPEPPKPPGGKDGGVVGGEETSHVAGGPLQKQIALLLLFLLVVVVVVVFLLDHLDVRRRGELEVRQPTQVATPLGHSIKCAVAHEREDVDLAPNNIF